MIKYFFKALIVLLCVSSSCASEDSETEQEEKKQTIGGPNLSVEAYYAYAKDKSGIALFTALHEIINDHQEYPYTSSNTDTWDILRQADQDPNNAENVVLIYSRESVNAAQEYNNGNGWNREHVWAKSRGDFGTSTGTGTDVHNLRASNININEKRSNHSFDYCTSGCVSISNCKYSESGAFGVFEPRDEDKGDVARIIFYMAVRYEGDRAGEPDLKLLNNTQSTASKEPYHGVKNTLLEWHKQDPVDDFERHRNAVIYQFQENRNPFIDYPDLVDYLWGDKQQKPWQ